MWNEPSIAAIVAAYLAMASENIGDHLCCFGCSILCDEIAPQAVRSPIAARSDALAPWKNCDS